MIDRNLLINDYDETKRKLLRKGVAEETVKEAYDQVVSRRSMVGEVDDLKAKVNSLSSKIGDLMRSGDRETADKVKAEVQVIKQSLGEKDAFLKQADDRVEQLLARIPNLVDDRVPDGKSEDDNVVLRYEGYDESLYSNKEFKPHWEIADSLGILDTKRAAKISGSMFAILRGDGAKLLRALVQLGLDLNRDRYEEFIVPHVARTSTLHGTCHLPKFAEDIFKMPEDDLWAIPTGEVPLTAYHADEILSGDQLPLRYMAYTACFRREAGSAGKETRGLQRLHEFHKLELVHIVPPSQGDEAFNGLLADSEKPLKLLGLPYRILDLCAGDLTFASSRMHDIEVYSPGTDTWLECSSVGLFTDFQARSSKIRFRKDAKAKAEPCYTLNGSGLATPRVIAALLEHGYKDGKVHLPECLHDYMGKTFIGG